MKQAAQFAFKQTIPVLCGYLFLGAAFGLLLNNAGYGVLWAFCISLVVFAGSGQFLLVTMLSAGMNLVNVAVLTFTVNSRHMFYGLSFIEKFKAMGKAYPYMIFSLTDETYSLLCGVKVPENIDKNKAFFLMALFDHLYWIGGSVLGNLLGSGGFFDITGVEYAMTALFIVIFVEQLSEYANRLPAVIGAVCGVVSLAVFKAENFILPALFATVVVLLLLRPVFGKREGGKA